MPNPNYKETEKNIAPTVLSFFNKNSTCENNKRNLH